MSQTGPSFGGYTPNYWYPANNASPLPNEPPATLTTSTTAIANLPGAAITGTQLANFTISYSVTLTFQGCPWFSPVTVPSSISTAASHQFFEYTYDLTANTALTACNPTGFSVTGQSITFTGFQEAGPTPPPGSTVEPSTYVQTFTAGHKYVVVLTGT
ncbi:MAG: hypothetical protein KGM44_10315 [bacterium]|nr:hypothetical protein [bacterium]